MDNNIIVLADKEGKETSYKYFASTTIEEKEYVVLIEQDTNNLTVAEVSEDDDGVEIFTSLSEEEESIIQIISKSILTYIEEDGSEAYIYIMDKFNFNEKEYAFCVMSKDNATVFLEIEKREDAVIQLKALDSEEEYQAVIDRYAEINPSAFSNDEECSTEHACCCTGDHPCGENCSCKSQSLIYLMNNDGEKVPFSIADKFQHNGQTYLILCENKPLDRNPDLAVVRAAVDESNNITGFEWIEDKEELAAARTTYLSQK